MRAAVKTSLVAAVASIPASFAAVILYVLVALHEVAGFKMLWVFALVPAIRGIPLAAVIGMLVARLPRSVPRLRFAILVGGIAAVGGALLAYWMTLKSPHVSAFVACLCFAVTWSVAAGFVAWLCPRVA
jgi:hypothetical protein